MIIFYDPFRQGQTQSPTAGLAGKAGPEDGFKPAFRYSFAGICHINVNMIGVFCDVNGDLTVPIHGIHGIFTEVFNDPFEQVLVYRDIYCMG